MVNIDFRISKPGTIFLISDSLASKKLNDSTDSDDSALRGARRDFIQRFGLTKEDNSFIEKYKAVRENFRSKKVRSIFIKAENLEEAYERLVEVPGFDAMNAFVEHFRVRCETIFDDYYQSLESRRKAVISEFSKVPIDDIIAGLEGFYDSKIVIENITFFLFPNSFKDRHGGRAYTKHGLSIIQPKRAIINSAESVLASDDVQIILHELIHFVEAGVLDKLRSVLKNHALSDKEIESFREGIAGSLFPYGFLSVEFGLSEEAGVLGYKNIRMNRDSDKYHNFLRKKFAANLYFLSQDFFLDGLNIFDSDYLSKALNVFNRIK
jgi:hypothetical protein